mgnify:CR=1 FL=1
MAKPGGEGRYAEFVKADDIFSREVPCGVVRVGCARQPAVPSRRSAFLLERSPPAQ